MDPYFINSDKKYKDKKTSLALHEVLFSEHPSVKWATHTRRPPEYWWMNSIFSRLASLLHFLWKAIQWSGWHIADSNDTHSLPSLWHRCTPHVSPSLTRQRSSPASVRTKCFLLKTFTTFLKSYFRCLLNVLLFLLRLIHFYYSRCFFPFLFLITKVAKPQFHIKQNLFWILNSPGVLLADLFIW